jgi:hypothetical protein
VEGLQLTMNALKEGLQIMDDFNDRLFEVNYLTETCLKFRNEKKVAASGRTDSKTLSWVIQTSPSLSSCYNSFQRCSHE